MFAQGHFQRIHRNHHAATSLHAAESSRHHNLHKTQSIGSYHNQTNTRSKAAKITTTTATTSATTTATATTSLDNEDLRLSCSSKSSAKSNDSSDKTLERRLSSAVEWWWFKPLSTCNKELASRAAPRSTTRDPVEGTTPVAQPEAPYLATSSIGDAHAAKSLAAPLPSLLPRGWSPQTRADEHHRQAPSDLEPDIQTDQFKVDRWLDATSFYAASIDAIGSPLTCASLARSSGTKRAQTIGQDSLLRDSGPLEVGCYYCSPIASPKSALRGGGPALALRRSATTSGRLSLHTNGGHCDKRQGDLEEREKVCKRESELISSNKPPACETQTSQKANEKLTTSSAPQLQAQNGSTWRDAHRIKSLGGGLFRLLAYLVKPLTSRSTVPVDELPRERKISGQRLQSLGARQRLTLVPAFCSSFLAYHLETLHLLTGIVLERAVALQSSCMGLEQSLDSPSIAQEMDAPQNHVSREYLWSSTDPILVPATMVTARQQQQQQQQQQQHTIRANQRRLFHIGHSQDSSEKLLELGPARAWASQKIATSNYYPEASASESFAPLTASLSLQQQQQASLQQMACNQQSNFQAPLRVLSSAPKDKAPLLSRCKTEPIFHEHGLVNRLAPTADLHDYRRNFGAPQQQQQQQSQSTGGANLRHANGNDGSGAAMSAFMRHKSGGRRPQVALMSMSFDSAARGVQVAGHNLSRNLLFMGPDEPSGHRDIVTSGGGGGGGGGTGARPKLERSSKSFSRDPSVATMSNLDGSTNSSRFLSSNGRWLNTAASLTRQPQQQPKVCGPQLGSLSRPYLTSSLRLTNSLDQHYNQRHNQYQAHFYQHSPSSSISHKLRRPASPLVLARLESEDFDPNSQVSPNLVAPCRQQLASLAKQESQPVGAGASLRLARQTTTTAVSQQNSIDQAYRPNPAAVSSDSELYGRFAHQRAPHILSSQNSSIIFGKNATTSNNDKINGYPQLMGQDMSLKQLAKQQSYAQQITGSSCSSKVTNAPASRAASSPEKQTLEKTNAKGKKSSSSSKISFTGAKRRLGFKQRKGLTSLSVQRSEEISPFNSSYLVEQHASTSSPLLSFSQIGHLHGHSRQPVSTSSCSCHFADPRSSFDVEGLGRGQIVMRQALVAPYLGDIQLSLSDRRGMLEVEVVRVRGLQLKPGATKLPFPFVKIYLMKDKKCLAKGKTNVVGQTLNPLYQQQFIFREDYSGCVLQVIVWGDYGRRDRKSLMGIVQIRLADLDMSNMVIGWYRMFNIPSIASSLLSSEALRHALL